MYKKILAAVNEHLNSEVAARYALQLARKADARIYFCSIVEKGLSGRTFQASERAIKRLSLQAGEMGVQAECVIETGDPLDRIRKIVRSESIDLVFAATRREDVKKRFYARTVARRLSLGLPCSVALVRVVHLGHVHPKTILVPLKAQISHIPERAYFTALAAGAFNANIHLFHTTRPMTRFFHGEIHLTPVEWESRLPADIMRFIEHLNRHEIAHEKKLIPGSTGRGITIEAAARKHELIIMGASERSLMNSLIRGNPVERVLRETTCDLIILKPKKTVS
ncbi:MAG TPA: universal stress protein [Nitrospirota bacterium]